MTQRIHRTLVSALALSLAACGSVSPEDPENDHRADGGPGGGGDGDAAPDGDGPTVLSVTPADGATGVAPDAEIQVTFSAAMDQASVEAAWSSEALPAAAVAFSWNPAGDVLTVTPADPLPVAEGDGSDPDAVPAISIGFAIGTGATDQDGAGLAAAFEAEFATIRRLELEVPYHADLTNSMVGVSNAPGAAGVEYAGDTSGNEQVKLAVSFALPELPEGAVLEAASLSADQTSATANIFNSLGGELEAVHVRFAQLSSAFAAGSLGTAGVFSSSVTAGPRSLAVTAAVADDMADAVVYSQFRLEFPLASNDDDGYDIAQFATDSFLLTLTYLIE